jgi:AraC family ethanolamine operon transcriptional activator
LSTILFPAGSVIELSNLNIEVMTEYIQKWSLEHSQMQRGVFSGSLFVVYTPRIQIYDSYYSHGFMTRGEFPDNCVLLAYIKTKHEILQYNETIPTDRIAILTKGDEIDYFAKGENRVYTLAVEREFFFQAFSDYFGEPFELHQDKKQFLLEKSKIAQFIPSLTIWMNHLKSQYLPHEYEKIELMILGSIFESLQLSINHQDKINCNISDIRAILDDNLTEFTTIADIARKVGISERHMLRLFKESFGISPKKYLQSLRFNAVKKELIDQDKEHINVTNTALKYNFLHMGYFSQEYKKFFGELPSHTLQKK